jgi:hypothetical protein
VADQKPQEPGELSEWLELMLAEVCRRQDEERAAAAEQASRAAPSPKPSTTHP